MRRSDIRLSSRVVAVLRERVLSGTASAGTRFTERSVAKELGVSARGKPEDIAERIDKARAESAPEAAQPSALQQLAALQAEEETPPTYIEDVQRVNEAGEVIPEDNTPDASYKVFYLKNVVWKGRNL